MKSNGDETQADVRSVAPVYLVWSGETTLNCSISEAWPHVVNYSSWQTYSTVQHVSGEPDREGEVVLLKKDEKGAAGYPPYYARTVKRDEGRRIIWKCYPQEVPKEGDFYGFVEFRVSEQGGKTLFWYNLIYEFQVPYQNISELVSFQKQQYLNAETLFEVILPKLKALVESRS